MVKANLFIIGSAMLMAGAFSAGAHADEVNNGEVFRNAAHNWEYRCDTYTAHIDGKTGRLVSLIVKGEEILAHGDDQPAGGMLYAKGIPFTATLVRLIEYNCVQAIDGNFGVWWHLYPDGIVIEYAVNAAEEPALAVFFTNTVTMQAEARPTPMRQPHPAHWRVGNLGITAQTRHGVALTMQGLQPVCLDRWAGKPVNGVSFGFPQAARVAGEIQIGPALPATAVTADVGFSTDAVQNLFPPTGILAFTTPITLKAETPVACRVAVTVQDFNTRASLASAAQQITLEPGKPQKLSWRMPWTTPGVYYASIRAQAAGSVIGVKDVVFVYDLAHWKPPLYRQPDFWQFWEHALREMRSHPLDPKMVLDTEKSAEDYQVYSVEITGCQGRRITGMYGEPTKPGQYPVVLENPHPGKALLMTVEEPHVAVAGVMEDQAQYRKGVGDRYTSNMLFVYLDYLRWLDFADSRGKADWTRCIAPAGSRGGPMVIAAAALDPRIKLIIMSVGTCNRWDWQVRYTGGWGPFLSDRRPGQSMNDFLKELSYFDASHFAERVKIPVVASWGMADPLSPINGQLSMCAYLAGPKFIMLQPGGGHTDPPAAFWNLAKELQRKLLAGEAIQEK